jgi:hypothetical protein
MDLDRRPDRDAAFDELLDGVARGLRVRPAAARLERGPLALLTRPHRAATTQLRVVEAVDEVRVADEYVQVVGPVLAVLEGAQAVENEALAGGAPRAQRLVEEKAVASEAIGLALDRAVGDAELARDLAQPGAAQEAVEDGPGQTYRWTRRGPRARRWKPFFL